MTASRWLVKTEPNTYSYADLDRDGRTVWDGVRNNTAALHLKAMQAGDEVFFYHSQAGKEIVGISTVVKEAYLDPTDATGKFYCVDLVAKAPLPRPFTLAEAKEDKALATMSLVVSFRLSVQPVTAAEWAHILKTVGA